MNSYLDRLPLTAEEKENLRQLGAPTPAALLSLIRASQERFRHFFDAARTQQLVAWLTPLLSEEERLRLDRPAPSYPIQHALFTDSVAPALPAVDFDIEERDRLFEQLCQLRGQSDPSPEVQQEIRAVEERLNTILD